MIDPSDDNRRAVLARGRGRRDRLAGRLHGHGRVLQRRQPPPPNLPAVPPGEDLTARMVAGALMLAAVIKEPEKAAEKYAAFLRTGLEIADGKNLWPTPPRAPPRRPGPPMKKR